MNNTRKSTIRNIVRFAVYSFIAFALINIIGMLVVNPFFAVAFALIATVIYWNTGAGKKSRK